MMPLLVLFAAARAVLAGDYDRAVQLDWEAIPGAESYDVEWFTGGDCSRSGGSDVSQGPSWKARLPGGSYCVRVRGVAAGGNAGQWTDFQHVDVRPKAPRKIDRDGDRFSWDRIPYATAYDAEVLDEAGKVVFRKTSKDPVLELDEAWLKSRKLTRDRLQVRVRTHVEGIEPSLFSKAATYPEFGKPLARLADAKVGKPAGPPPPPPPLEAGPGAAAERLKKFALSLPTPLPAGPQPVPQALEPEDAVARFTLAGEKPLPPTAEEWARAKSEVEKGRLRRRSIASQRVELAERIEARRPPQFGFTFRAGLGSAGDVKVQDSRRETDRRGLAPATGFELTLDRDRPWSYFLDADFDPSLRGAAPAFVSGALGLMRNMWLDASGDAVLHLGGGLSISRIPLEVSNPAPGFIYTFNSWGLAAKAGFTYRFLPRWRATLLGSILQAFPSEEVPRYFEGAETEANRMELRAGAAFGWLPEWELGAGLYALRHRGVTDGGSSSSGYDLRLSSVGVYAQATYLIGGPGGARDPAAETRVELDVERLWNARLELSNDWRSGLVNNTELGAEAGQPAPVSGGSPGYELALRRKWSNRSPLWLSLRQGTRQVSAGSRTETEWSLRFGPAGEWLILGRRDLWFRAAALVYWRRAVGLASFGAGAPEPVSAIRVYGLEPELSVQKHWGARYAGTLTVGLGLPLATYTGLGEPSTGGAFSESGRSFSCRTELTGSYRLSERWSALLTYGLEIQRYALSAEQYGSPAAPTMALDIQAHRLGMGIQLSW